MKNESRIKDALLKIYSVVVNIPWFITNLRAALFEYFFSVCVLWLTWDSTLSGKFDRVVQLCSVQETRQFTQVLLHL